MYITFAEYSQLYGKIDEATFDRLVFDACRVMDIHTTGIDNVKKLKRFPPVDADDDMAVKHCAAKIVKLLYQINHAEATALESAGYESTEMGMRGKVISSITAGNESISYVAGNSSATAIDAAAKDKTVRNKLIADIVWEYLSCVTDSNGVNLLYMGHYPRGYLC